MLLTKVTAATVVGGLACLGLSLVFLGCGGLRASTVPLGGKHVEEVASAKKLPAAASSETDVAPTSHEDEAPTKPVATIEPTPAPLASTSSAPAAVAAPGAFAFKPFAAHQVWTRLFDMEFDLKVGPGGSIDMKMVSHQEVRFEVLSVGSSGIEKLSIDYSVYTSKMTIMGQTQDSPEELAGKRFVVSFTGGKPEVRDASGGTPPKKQVDSVKDDAREPLEIEKSLRELAQLVQKGSGDFSQAGAIALAGGEDEDTKVPRAKATLQRISSGSRGEKLALVDLSYTLTNAIDDQSTIEVQVAGPLSVLDAPARYQTSTLQGAMELRSSQPGGMQGRGTIKVTTSYKY
ncbi:MAG TPA: hypothetical protein VHB79_18325 [Polyangiaceae bacterium]|nr:hypothetical protein [Polyangiaceae bacterium]